MKKIVQKLFSGFILTSILLSCQPRIIEIPLVQNNDFDQNFGFTLKFDKRIILGDNDREVMAGKAKGDLLVAYEPISGTNNINFWIDSGRDGNLKNDLPYELAIDTDSDNIYIKGRGKLSDTKFPYKVRVRGTIEKPYIRITSNYSFDGFVTKSRDTLSFRLWDPNSDGLFDLNDVVNGNLICQIKGSPERQLIPVNQLVRIFDDYYELDSLPADMSFIRFKRAELQAITENIAPKDFSIELINGEKLRYKDLLGSWVLIDFFGNTRNQYDLQNIDAAKDYYNLHNDSIRLISISCDALEYRDENIEKLMELDLLWEIGFTEKSSDLWKMFGSSPGCGMRTPFRVLFKPDGKVCAAGQELGKTWVGQKAPNFKQKDPDGNSISLADLIKGKYILLDFWASWCSPCIEEIPIIQKANSRYSDKNLEIVSISWDYSHQEWTDAIQKYNMNWINLTDLKGYKNQVGQQYGLSFIPASILLNPEGIIIAKNIRGEELSKKLAEILE